MLTAKFKPVGEPLGGWVSLTYTPLTRQYGDYLDYIIYANGRPVGMTAFPFTDTGEVAVSLCPNADGATVPCGRTGPVITGKETYTITAIAGTNDAEPGAAESAQSNGLVPTLVK